MDMEWLRQRLAPDFVHVSPFGRFEDRESYLAAVEPLARKSVVELRVKDVIASGNQAAVRFENRTPEGRSNPVTGSASRMTRSRRSGRSMTAP
jgi:hypothetical protein